MNNNTPVNEGRHLCRFPAGMTASDLRADPPSSLQVETDFELAGELLATATFLSAMHVGVGVHLDRLARAADWLKGKRPNREWKAQWLIQNDAVCHAIYTLGMIHERRRAEGRAAAEEVASTRKPL